MIESITTEPPGTKTATTETVMTIGEALRLYEELHIATLRQPAPVRTRIKLYFGPLLPIRLDRLTTVDVIRWHRGMCERSVEQARGSLMLLRAMYRKLNEWGIYTGPCPAWHLRLKRPAPRRRYLEPHELRRVLQVLAQEPPRFRAFFYLVLFTSCRPGEAERVEWSHLKLWVDSASQTPIGTWTKPLTKNGLAHTVPLPAVVAQALLEHQATTREASSYVFPGQKRHPFPPQPTKSKTGWHHLWVRIRQAAGVPDVRRHDLRRTCATYLLDQGMDLLTLSKAVLNHTNLSSTSVYAQPLHDTVRAQLTKNCERMMAYAFSPATRETEPVRNGQGQPPSNPGPSGPTVNLGDFLPLKERLIRAYHQLAPDIRAVFVQAAAQRGVPVLTFLEEALSPKAGNGHAASDLPPPTA